MQIKNEKIYVLDAFSRIVCYDMQGNVIFKIDAVGAGPGEYVRISAFAINEQSRELVIYDNPKTTLLYYNSDNGKHIKTEKFPKPNPGAMASSDGVYYYDNQFHSNSPTTVHCTIPYYYQKTALILFNAILHTIKQKPNIISVPHHSRSVTMIPYYTIAETSIT